jgi:DnaJ-class molecular chaperone
MTECDKCAGTGEVMVGEKKVGGMMKPRYDRCNECGGDGEVRDEPSEKQLRRLNPPAVGFGRECDYDA